MNFININHQLSSSSQLPPLPVPPLPDHLALSNDFMANTNNNTIWPTTNHQINRTPSQMASAFTNLHKLMTLQQTSTTNFLPTSLQQQNQLVSQSSAAACFAAAAAAIAANQQQQQPQSNLKSWPTNSNTAVAAQLFGKFNMMFPNILQLISNNNNNNNPTNSGQRSSPPHNHHHHHHNSSQLTTNSYDLMPKRPLDSNKST